MLEIRFLVLSSAKIILVSYHPISPGDIGWIKFLRHPVFISKKIGGTFWILFVFNFVRWRGKGRRCPSRWPGVGVLLKIEGRGEGPCEGGGGRCSQWPGGCLREGGGSIF